MGLDVAVTGVGVVSALGVRSRGDDEPGAAGVAPFSAAGMW